MALTGMTYEEASSLFGPPIGAAGVDIFFVISGFVISISANKAKNGLNFLVQRFTRISIPYYSPCNLSCI